jgi:hypothetical protein
VLDRATVLRKVHLRPGRISLDQVLRLAVVELDVRPLRQDWAEVLDRTEERFEEWRTWPRAPQE